MIRMALVGIDPEEVLLRDIKASAKKASELQKEIQSPKKKFDKVAAVTIPNASHKEGKNHQQALQRSNQSS